jgi:hypothetical protein
MDHEQKFQMFGKFGHDFFAAKISGALAIVDAFQIIEKTLVRHVAGQPETSIVAQTAVRLQKNAAVKIPDCFWNALEFVGGLLPR